MTTNERIALRDKLAHYFKGELDADTNEVIYEAACEIALGDGVIYLVEICYAIGYKNSLLAANIGETTYKKMKKLVADNLLKRLIEKCGYTA